MGGGSKQCKGNAIVSGGGGGEDWGGKIPTNKREID